MARNKGFHFEGLDEYVSKLKKLANTKEYEQAVGKAVYAGAGVVADSIRNAINALPTTRNQHGTSEKKIDGCTPLQKRGLLEGLGITPMQRGFGTDYWHVKIGFDGYNYVYTEKYPNGQPNSLIARSIESGTSFRNKRPFIAPAINKSKKQAEQIMADMLEQEISKIMEE